MSREDPQFKLRMPADLRAQAEQAAKAAGRSMNAELVARLEASYLGEGADVLMPAKRARELALMARESLPKEIRRRAVEAVSRAVRLGHSEAVARLDDLGMEEGIPDQELENILNGAITELEAAGYKVKYEDISALWIEF